MMCSAFMLVQADSYVFWHSLINSLLCHLNQGKNLVKAPEIWEFSFKFSALTVQMSLTARNDERHLLSIGYIRRTFLL